MIPRVIISYLSFVVESAKFIQAFAKLKKKFQQFKKNIWVCVFYRKQYASLNSFLSTSDLFCNPRWKFHASFLFKASVPIVPSSWYSLCLPSFTHTLCFKLSHYPGELSSSPFSPVSLPFDFPPKACTSCIKPTYSVFLFPGASYTPLGKGLFLFFIVPGIIE